MRHLFRSRTLAWMGLFIGFAFAACAAFGAARADEPDAGTEVAEEREAPRPVSLRELQSRGGAVPWYQRATSALGLAVMILIAWGLSTHKRLFPWRVVLWGTGLQLLFGVLVLKTYAGLKVFSFLNDVIARLLDFTADGSRFLFGSYLDSEFTVALNVLPTIIFFSSLMSVLYHVNAVQPLVRGIAWVMQRTLKTSGAETLSAAANIFVGQTEAPLVVRPFVATMTKSELHAVMVAGFASIAGGVLAAYVGMLQRYFPDVAGHMISASVLSAPASLVIAKVMVPETEEPKTAGTLHMDVEKPYANVIDAAAGGAADGLKLAFNVGAMLLAFIALVAMVNYVIELPALWHNQAVWEQMTRVLAGGSEAIPESCAAPRGASAFGACIDSVMASGAIDGNYTSWQPWTLQRALGYVFWPIAWVMGVPPADCAQIGALLGEKTILNEFVAYMHLGEQLGNGTSRLSPRAVVIATYALCGFANIGSIAIQIGGIGGMAPERRGDLARLGVRAMIAGSLASFMTACIAGLLV